jgi:hypothetical protein
MKRVSFKAAVADTVKGSFDCADARVRDASAALKDDIAD